MRIYKDHWVCIPCRLHKKDREQWKGLGFIVPVCTNCGKEMLNFGKDFQAPRKAAGSQWRKLELIKDSNWGSCGCDGPGKKPKTLAGAKNGMYGERIPRNIGKRTR